MSTELTHPPTHLPVTGGASLWVAQVVWFLGPQRFREARVGARGWKPRILRLPEPTDLSSVGSLAPLTETASVLRNSPVG